MDPRSTLQGLDIVKAGFKSIYFVVPRKWEQEYKDGKLDISHLNVGHTSLFQLMHKLERRHFSKFDHSFDITFVCSDMDLYTHLKKYVRSRGYQEGLV